MRLQRADTEYATRAGSNNAHFLLARPKVDFTAANYMQDTLRAGSEINAVGVWGWYHLSALQKATRLARENLAPEERSALALAMLADEAFALHFLQDVFAAGHVAGTWGDVSQRKGTHDYYNAGGLEVRTWQGAANTFVLMGDAHMRPEDAERAAAAVRLSLEQLLDTVAWALAPRPIFRTCRRRPPNRKRSMCARTTSFVPGRRDENPLPKPCRWAWRSCCSRRCRAWVKDSGRCHGSGRKSVRSSAWRVHSTCAIWTVASRAWKVAAASLAAPTCRCASDTESKA